MVPRSAPWQLTRSQPDDGLAVAAVDDHRANVGQFEQVRGRGSEPRVVAAQLQRQSMTHESAFVPPALPSCGQFDIALPRLMDRFLIDKPYFRKVRSARKRNHFHLKVSGAAGWAPLNFQSGFCRTGPQRSY